MGEKNGADDGFIYHESHSPAVAVNEHGQCISSPSSSPESKSSRVSIFLLLFVIRAADGSPHSCPLSHRVVLVRFECQAVRVRPRLDLVECTASASDAHVCHRTILLLIVRCQIGVPPKRECFPHESVCKLDYSDDGRSLGSRA